MKKYILCELNDENYTDAIYSFHKTYKEAKKEALVDCVDNFEGNCEIETERDGFRITSQDEDSFFVTEIRQIDTSKGTHLLIWHHAYDGVDFAISFQGTYEECKAKMKEEINKVADELELLPEDICGNSIDTGEEWQVWDVVKCGE